MRNKLFSTRLRRVTTSLAAAAVCVAGGALNAHADEADAGTVAVQTVPARRGPIGQPVRAYGMVSASGSSITTVTLPYVAHIARLLAQAGQPVKRGAPLATLARYSRQRRKVALDVVQQTTLRNRAILNTREPEARRAYYDELRRVVDDPHEHRAYVMRTSMIQSLRDVASLP